MAKHPDPDHHTYTEDEMRDARGDNPVEPTEPRRDIDGFPIRKPAVDPENVAASRPTGPRGQGQG